MSNFPTDEQIDQTFPDNDTGEIGADDMRFFQKTVSEAGDSKLDTIGVTGAGWADVTRDTEASTVVIDVKIEAVAALPSTPDPNTIYLVI